MLKEGSPLIVFTNQYVPRPLNVYGKPSIVLRCGSPKEDAEQKITNSETIYKEEMLLELKRCTTCHRCNENSKDQTNNVTRNEGIV